MPDTCPRCGADPLRLDKRYPTNGGNLSRKGNDDAYYVCRDCGKQIRDAEK